MEKQTKPGMTVSPYLLWFLIHGTQTDVTMLIFQRNIIKGAEQDAWVSLLLVGLSMHAIVMVFMYALNRSNGGDLMGLHRQLFGRWVGSALSLAFYGYALLFLVVQVRSYIEVIHIWVFPYTPLWEFSLLVLLTSLYIVAGGFRVVAGICFWSVVIPSIVLVTLYYPLMYAHWDNFLPLLNHRLPEYAESARHALPVYLGAEFMLIYYPFIGDKGSKAKWAHIGIGHTTALNLLFAVVTIAYFNLTQLQHTIWPTLMLSKVAHMPFLERFDYIYVFTWFSVILPPCCLALWCGTRVLKKTTGLPVRWGMWLTGAAAWVATLTMKSPMTIERLNAMLSLSGGIILYIYIPALAVCLAIRRQLKPAGKA